MSHIGMHFLIGRREIWEFSRSRFSPCCLFQINNFLRIIPFHKLNAVFTFPFFSPGGEKCSARFTCKFSSSDICPGVTGSCQKEKNGYILVRIGQNCNRNEKHEPAKRI